MSHPIWTLKSAGARFATLIGLLALVILLVSCKKPEDSKPAQSTFASPAEAGAALVDAAKSGDQQAFLAIFGPEGKDVLFSGDPVKDKNALQDFVADYVQMNRWREIKAGGETLYVGADNYPFPIPLAKNSTGQWSFDTAAGKDEILARRIGKGELAGSRQDFGDRQHRGILAEGDAESSRKPHQRSRSEQQQLWDRFL